jgi:DnaA family protein
MHKSSTQLTLGLSLKDEATFANFYPAKNAEIIAELKKTASGVGEHVIYIYGTHGQGCSHLLQATCHYAHQHHLSSVYFPLAHLISMSTDILNGLEQLDVVCIDDLHIIAGHAAWEEAIFHLYNRMHDAGKKIIVAANDSPKFIKLELPDVVSRLSSGIVFQLRPLMDAEKLLILIQRAHSRGISLSEEVGKFILTHYPRHMGTLFAALDALDKASLAAQRRLTIPFVKEVLEI